MFALSILWIIILDSCSKEHPEIKQTVPALTEESNSFVNNLLNFKGKLDYIKENPHYKSCEMMEADSAVWYMETLFNAVYAYPDDSYTQTVSDSALLQIPLDENGFVNFGNIAFIYEELYNVVRELYIESGIDDKGFVLLDLELIEVTDTNAEFEVLAVTGESNPGSGITYDPFGEQDYWYYGQMFGDCDLSQFENTDAAQQISAALMAHRPIYIPCPSCYYIYSDIQTKYLFGDEYTDENGDYLIFYIMHENGVFTDDEKCLCPEEMNFHFHGEETVIYDKLENELEKKFMHCELEGLTDEDDNYNPRIRHHNTLTFGIPHLIVVEIPIEKKKIEE
jgi:hypothetical protein